VKNIYLSGPMKGHPESNYPLFNSVAAELRSKGHHVYNPAEYPHDGEFPIRKAFAEYCNYICLRADTIVLLPGWDRSIGAKVEKGLAQRIGLAVEFWRPKGEKGGLDRDEFHRLWREGVSQVDIAGILGVSPGYISVARKKFGFADRIRAKRKDGESEQDTANQKTTIWAVREGITVPPGWTNDMLAELATTHGRYADLWKFSKKHKTAINQVQARFHASIVRRAA